MPPLDPAASFQIPNPAASSQIPYIYPIQMARLIKSIPPVSHVIHGYFTPVSHFHSNKLISESEVEHSRELTAEATHTDHKR